MNVSDIEPRRLQPIRVLQIPASRNEWAASIVLGGSKGTNTRDAEEDISESTRADGGKHVWMERYATDQCLDLGASRHRSMCGPWG